MNTTIDRPIEEAKNIGTTITKRLNEIEIYSLADYKKQKAAQSFRLCGFLEPMDGFEPPTR